MYLLLGNAIPSWPLAYTEFTNNANFLLNDATANAAVTSFREESPMNARHAFIPFCLVPLSWGKINMFKQHK